MFGGKMKTTEKMFGFRTEDWLFEGKYYLNTNTNSH